MIFFDKLFRKQKVSSGVVTQNLGTPRWSIRNYTNFATEAYTTNYVSFRCIDLIGKSVASVCWKVFKKVDDGREEQPNHPLAPILHRANPDTGFSYLQYAVAAFLALDGNSYVEKLRPKTGPNKDIPLELEYHRPDQIKFLEDRNTGELLGYFKERNGSIIKQWEIDPITRHCDLLQIKTFHPINDVEGLSPVEPASRSIDTSNEALTWNKKLLENDARPGTMFIFDGALGDDQFRRLRDQLERKYSGSFNVGKNLIIEGALKDAKPFGFNPAELDFSKGTWDLARQICMTWGVPPQVLGVPGDSTFANFEQARLYLWETTIFFYLMLLRDEYNNWLFPDTGEFFIDCELDDVPALAPRRKEKWEMVEKSTFLTVNEKREEIGMEAVEGGDVILIPANMIPLGMDSLTEEDVNESEEEVETEIDEDMQAMITEFEKDTCTHARISPYIWTDGVMYYHCIDCGAEVLLDPEEGKPYPNEHACRLENPAQFDSFRRQNNAGKVNGKRIDHIYGIKAGKSKLQAIRYPKSVWSAGEARSHCSGRSGSFEAAGKCEILD